MPAQTKVDALGFLRELEKALNRQLLPAADMDPAIRKTVAESKIDDRAKHLRAPEAAFLNGHALPVLFDVLQTVAGLSPEEAREALLNEYHRTMPAISKRSPIRWERHPFTKALGANAAQIYEGWKNPEVGRALTQSCPDFALRAPFPHTILFEGKYFPRGGAEYARRTLVNDIYQAFFYRGLPALDATAKHPEWRYDYACLMAFDASPTGTLAAAWDELDPRTKKSFWDGANLYVMILRGPTVA